MSTYDWDPEKVTGNVRKHGITFVEAEQAIEDPLSIEGPDELGYADVRRRVFGETRSGWLLLVIVSESRPRPRIISARRATKRERHAYETRS